MPRRLDAAGDSRSSERFRDAHRGHGTGAHPQSDDLLRAHADQEHLQSVPRPPENGASGIINTPSFRAAQTARNLAIEAWITQFSVSKCLSPCDLLRSAQDDIIRIRA